VNLGAWATRQLKPIAFLTLLLCFLGAVAYTTFPVSILPDVTFPRVVVIAEAGDLPTKTVEASITRVLEEAISTVPNVARLRSKTQRGSTEISVDFGWGTDIVQAEQLVNAKVNGARGRLPLDVVTEVERMNPTVFPVIGVSLQSKSLSQAELWSLATYSVRLRLSRVPGVARVVVQGGREPEYQVEVNPAALGQFRVTLGDVVTALKAANQVRSAGGSDGRFVRVDVMVDNEAATGAALGDVVVTNRNGPVVRVSDVATVRRAVSDRSTVVAADRQESVLLNVVRQPSANSVAMVAAIQTELASIRKALPRGTTITPFYDQSVIIRDSVQSVQEAVLIGAALSVVVLLLFLGDLRATLVTAAIIPATVLITFLFMRLSGLTLNLMTLGALAVGIGLVIDDAIVVVENVFRHLSHGESPSVAVRAGAAEIAGPMTSSTMTTVVVFLPLVLLEGVAGAFFTALALTLTIALIVSLGLALTVSPSLCAAFLRTHGKSEHGPLFERFLQGYTRSLRWCLGHRAVVGLLAVGCLGVAAWLGPQLESGFMPTMDEGAFVLDYWTPPGSSLTESDRLLRKVDDILRSTPEIGSFSRRTGTELGFAITEPNRGDYAVMLKDGSRRNIEYVMGEIREKINAEIPGLDVEFIQVLQDLIGDLAGTPSPIEVKLFGENKGDVEASAAQLAESLGKVPGLVDVASGVVPSGPELGVKLDPLVIGRVGLTPTDVADQAQTAVGGQIAATLLENDRPIPVRVRYPSAYRADPEMIGNAPIGLPSGGSVPLGSLGTISRHEGSAESSREDQRRMVSVTAGLEGVDLGTAVGRVRTAVAGLALPPGVTAVIAGQSQTQAESFRNLAEVLGLAVLLVFVVMLFQFRTFRAPLVILMLMPLAVVGAVVGLYLTKTPLNVSSFMGAIMLAGVVVKNGILLLDRAQHDLQAGRPVVESMVEAGRARLRPILMTTLTAVLGLIPLALGIGAGAEMQKPLAIAVVSGLVFSTLLTLFLGPVLYATVMEFGNGRRVETVTEG
jgi:CzcA family heavy metal efflux pump